MKKLWGGRFSGESNVLFETFNASFPVDWRLIHADILGSQGYAAALKRAGVFSDQEYASVIKALEHLKEKYAQESPHLKEELYHFEDVHAFVEAKLIEQVGDVGKKLHTGRSRNDQVSTDMRIYLRESIDQISVKITDLIRTLIDLSTRYETVILPGFTHLQKAQPILFSHFLLSFGEMFLRDRSRLKQLRERVNQLPLGSGAIAGNNYDIDRQFLAEQLNFSDVCRNSLDASSDRDFVLEFLSAASIAMIHFSRLSEDLIIYNSDEFGYVSMGEQVSTGSSLMPQKKNPDALELIRGKAGRVIGNQMSLLVTLKGLPSCYNKDLQEDKEPLFDTIDTWSSCLDMMKLVLETLSVNEDTMEKDAKTGYLNATDLADYLVSKGLSFRDSHRIAGQIVQYAITQKKLLTELTIDELKKFCTDIDEHLSFALGLTQVIEAKKTMGGTSSKSVQKQISWMQEQIGL